MDDRAIFEALDLGVALRSAGKLQVRSPIDGRELARVATDSAKTLEAKITRADAAFRDWRSVPAPRRGELVRLIGEELRAAKEPLGALVTVECRQDPAGRSRRGAGDDRHLRLRGRPVAPALRPDHRLRTAGSPDDGDLAPARPGRGDHRLQLSRRRLGVELRARAGLRRHRGVEAVGEDAAVRARLPATSSSARSKRFGDAPDGLLEVVIGDREIGETLVADRRVPLISATGLAAWAARWRPSWRRGSAARCSSSAATTR